MTRPEFVDRTPRPGIADDARVIWIDEAFAASEGIDVERLTATYAEIGIRLVIGTPVSAGRGRVICPGCSTAYRRDRENWRPCDIAAGGWRPLCRVCENTEWSAEPSSRDRRRASYEADPGLLTRPGIGTGKSPSWTHGDRKTTGPVRRPHRGSRLGRLG